MTPTQHIFHVPRPGRLGQYIKARLHAPEIESDSAGQILGAYGLKLARPPENLAFGWRNRNVVVHTSAGKKVLKMYGTKWPVSTIIHEHSIFRQLEATNFPAPRLLETEEGQSLVNQDGRFYALFDFVDGTNFTGSYLLRAQRQKLIALAGQTLARFHRQLAGFLPEGRHHLGYQSYSAGRQRDLAWHLNLLSELQEKSGKLTDPEAKIHAQWLCQKSSYIAEGLCQLEATLETAALPRLIIHGDYGLHNLIFHPDGTATVHDFELTRLEWRLIDLVVVLSRLDFEKSRPFMDAYQAEYELTSEERHLLPQVWQYYRLRGAVQYWHNHFELDGRYRLAAARERVNQADWALEHSAKLQQLTAAPRSRSPARDMRVMMVARLFYPWIGGTERQAHKLAQKLIEKQVAVELATGWWFQGTPQRETIDAIPVYRNFTLWEFLGIKGLRKFGGYLYILSLLWYLWRRRADYDVIHIHGLNYHTFAAVVAGRLFGKKTVAKLANSGHASDINKMRRNMQLALSRYMLPTALKCDRFVALNKKVVQELTAVGVPRQKIVELPNGVETDVITARSSYTLHNPARLIFVGRLHPQKGLDTVLHAVHQLRQDHPAVNICLQLLGDGPLKASLMHLADQLGIATQVEFLGQSDQVIEHLQQADIFVLPSRAEGVSNALLEAMACGLPVVVSAIPGNVDVIEDDENGLLFTVDDPDSLAQNLISLLAQPDLRERLGRKARQTVKRHYSLSYVANRYIALYQELLAGEQVIARQPVK